MMLAGFRVARRNEPDLAGSWGLWSDERKRWLYVIYATEREATDMLAHLRAVERRRDLPDHRKR